MAANNSTKKQQIRIQEARNKTTDSSNNRFFQTAGENQTGTRQERKSDEAKSKHTRLPDQIGSEAKRK